MDFGFEINEIITETRNLELLGYKVPELARNVALQDEYYNRIVEGLNKMIDSYHRVMKSLEPIEAKILNDEIKEIKRAIRPGLRRLNWNSLGISDYIEKCNLLLHGFESKVTTIHKVTMDIEEKLKDIDNAKLFNIPSGNKYLKCKVSFSYLITHKLWNITY